MDKNLIKKLKCTTLNLEEKDFKLFCSG